MYENVNLLCRHFPRISLFDLANWLKNKKDIKKKHTSIESKIRVFRTQKVTWYGHIVYTGGKN